jgi:uncharacterized SAM-binding protein YcdF (DUF218 family)
MRKFITIVLACLVLASGAYLLRERVLIAAGSFLVSEDPPIQADAIAVLSGDVPYRILEGIDLFHHGRAPRILLTPYKGDMAYRLLLTELGVDFLPDDEVNRRIAINRGVPAQAIEVLRPVGSTRDEAEVILAYLKSRKLRSVIVVTSEYHSTRTRLIFRSMNGDGMKVAIHPSRYDPFDFKAWWKSRAESKQLFYEYVKLLNHYTFGF